jgi:endoglucanase
MDEIGLMVKHVDDNGFIRFIKCGGWFDQTLLTERVILHSPQGDVCGIIGAKPPHVMKAEEKKSAIRIGDMFIDIGAKSKKEAEKAGVTPGVPITLDRTCARLLHSRLTGKALDDRVGVAMMIEALRQTRSAVTIYAVGTVQEEVGLKGARTSAFGLDPDVALVSEVSIAGDYPGIESKHSPLKIGDGPSITIADASGRGLITPHIVLKWITETAKKEKIPYQLDVSESGTTDAAAIQITKAGIPCGVISVPTRYMHSGVEMVDIRDVEKGALLIAKSLESVDKYFPL